jgi:hypothetical protein
VLSRQISAPDPATKATGIVATRLSCHLENGSSLIYVTTFASVVDCGHVFAEEVAHSTTFFQKVTAITAKHGMAVDSDSATHKKLREAVDGGHIFRTVGKTESAIGMFRLAEAILDVLNGMHYTLWYSDAASFVCSDYPVGLFY